ncbi:MAG: SAM-dependent methyltransferase [Chitinophagaceae bacterium]|nr:MAG: SAM-dependent methyltransferase [Chitinophagaceae bacterium]
MASTSNIFLIPCFLDETALNVIPAYVLDAVKQCQVFYVENERSARRYLKASWREMVIDDYEWVTIHKAEPGVRQQLISHIRAGKNIGIISEAGCPAIADPGQLLVETAHQHGAVVKPLVGPSSILLALMASGMNGQQFRFAGYLPIDNAEKMKFIRELENDSSKRNSTQIFIETPYRNNQLIETLLKTLQPATRLCIAADLTGEKEFIRTMSVADWKKNVPELHKRPAIFCLLSPP